MSKKTEHHEDHKDAKASADEFSAPKTRPASADEPTVAGGKPDTSERARMLTMGQTTLPLPDLPDPGPIIIDEPAI